MQEEEYFRIAILTPQITLLMKSIIIYYTDWRSNKIVYKLIWDWQSNNNIAKQELMYLVKF